MMGMLRIALLQISPLGSAEKNMQKGITWCRKASQEGADIALFPEMWTKLSQMTAVLSGHFRTRQGILAWP